MGTDGSSTAGSTRGYCEPPRDLGLGKEAQEKAPSAMKFYGSLQAGVFTRYPLLNCFLKAGGLGRCKPIYNTYTLYVAKLIH
jgi:hypothetical protein